MGYVLVGAVLLMAAIAWWLVNFAIKENQMVPRFERPSVRLRMRRAPAVAADGTCTCGGVIGPSGRESARYGQLLGCTGCDRAWSTDGRALRLRSARTGRTDND